MKFGVSCAMLPAETPLDVLREYVELAEDVGMEFLGSGDMVNRNYECYVFMTVLAMLTKRARFMPTITNPVTRHPAIAAAAWASLKHLSGGRAMMGIGTGNSAVLNLGLPSAKVADLREHVETVQALLRDGETQYRGATVRVPWAKDVVPGGVPIYIAADGPKALELAGEIADGVLIGGGIAPEYVARARAAVGKGAAKSGRTIRDLDIWHMADIALADSREAALRQGSEILAATASQSFRMSMDALGVPEQFRRPLAEFNRRYDYSQHVTGTNGDLLGELGLLEFMADRYMVAGTRDQVIARLKEIASYGVDQIYLPNMNSEPFGFLRKFRDQILPAVKDVVHWP